MAELNIKQNVSTKKVRIRKAAPKVDLTAMVDLAFLLITFFMLTTSLNKPNRLDVAVPDKSENSIAEIDEKRILSLVINEESIIWYHGDLNKPLHEPTTIIFKNNGLKNLLTAMDNKIKQTTDGKDMIVLIKPSEHARTKDIIETLDQIKKSNIKRYILSKATYQDQRLI